MQHLITNINPIWGAIVIVFIGGGLFGRNRYAQNGNRDRWIPIAGIAVALLAGIIIASKLQT